MDLEECDLCHYMKNGLETVFISGRPKRLCLSCRRLLEEEKYNIETDWEDDLEQCDLFDVPNM